MAHFGDQSMHKICAKYDILNCSLSLAWAKITKEEVCTKTNKAIDRFKAIVKAKGSFSDK